jgi:hypothetical protein
MAFNLNGFFQWELVTLIITLHTRARTHATHATTRQVFGSDCNAADPAVDADPAAAAREREEAAAEDAALLAQVEAAGARLAEVEAALAGQQRRGATSAADRLGWARYLADDAAARAAPPQQQPQQQLQKQASGGLQAFAPQPRAVSTPGPGRTASQGLGIRPQLSLPGGATAVPLTPAAAALLQPGMVPFGGLPPGASVQNQLAAARAATQQQQLLQQQQRAGMPQGMTLPRMAGPGGQPQLMNQQAALLYLQQQVQMQHLAQQRQQQQLQQQQQQQPP